MADNNISCELNKKGSTITKETIEGLKDTVRNLYLADDIPWVMFPREKFCPILCTTASW